ncbi:EAL domain-containing protein [bacterium]|nr:EAL domain-containing protein [bacterium]MBU1989107.1 EAL domain-containing protein [bacterium]
MDLSNNITITDKKGIISYVNEKFCVLSGYKEEELVGKPHSIVRHPDMPKSFFKNMWSTILNKQVWQGIIKNRRKDGSNFYIETTIAPILDNKGQIVEFISIKTDITSLILNKEQLQSEIITDRLTSLPNRIKLQEDIKKDEEASLLILDINHFKEINLLFGVSLGDEALMYLAQTIVELIPAVGNASAYRVSADEFAVYKSGNCVEEFEAFANAVRSFIQKHPFKYQEISFDIDLTCSIAYKNMQIENLFEAALDALDSAKKAKHFLHIFDELSSKQHEYEKNFEWTRKIKEALLDERIRAYFQPIYDVQKKSITKYEALVRLIQEDGTVISPFVFLEVAKHSRLYSQITRAMINQGCAMFAKRKEILTLNFSIEDLLDEETIEYFISAVSENNMKNRVIAEVLESEGIENFETFRNVLTRLKENGIRVAIDDFGSGYSNFSYLINLDIDILKIDGSLIRNVNIDQNSKIIVQSIAMFARELGMQTVAEFVSDKEIFDTVKVLGIDLIQGYYIAQPSEEPQKENKVVDF